MIEPQHSFFQLLFDKICARAIEAAPRLTMFHTLFTLLTALSSGISSFIRVERLARIEAREGK